MIPLRLLACLCPFVFGCVAMATEPQPIVRTETGALAGAYDAAGAVAVFKGIPFAAPPVGDLRWREPQPVASWSGVRDATKFGPSPMQRLHGDMLPWTREFLVQNEASEDCLYLNVWTPRGDPEARRPVIVFIPGGGFVEGSGEVPIYDGTALACEGVVLVTINYRLGVFGFFAHPELTAESPHHASGNYALLDQVAALRWVRRNVAAFGGDPHCVTVWGQSAGAFSVGALLAAPQGKGLFERAVASSGLGVSGRQLKTLAVAEQEGVAQATAHHVTTLAALRAVPAADLLTWSGSGPIVDGWLLPDSPAAIDRQGGGSDVPVLTGYTGNDGMLAVPKLAAVADYDRYLETTLGDRASEFRRLYPAEGLMAMQATLGEATADRERVSAFLWARQRRQTHRVPVFTYFFVRGIPWPEHPEYGAFHSGDLPYFFRNLAAMDRPWEPADRRVSETVSRYLIAFATEGRPKVAGLPAWPAAEPDRPETIELGETVRVVPLATEERVAFWTRYFEAQAAKAPLF